MLLITGSVPPPGIVGYDRKHTGPHLHVPGAIFSIYGLITNWNTDHYALSAAFCVIFEMPDAGNMFLPHATPHHSPEFIVDGNEYFRIWREFRSHDQFTLMEYIRTARSIGKDGGIVVHHPAIPKTACKYVRLGVSVTINVVGRCPEKQPCPGMAFKEGLETAEGVAGSDVVQKDVPCESFRCDKQTFPVAVALQGFFVE